MPSPACRLSIRVVPNASRDEIAGWLAESLKVKLRAPALDGRANEALCRFLAEKLRLPQRQVAILQGEKSRQKLIEIHGVTIEEARSRLSP
ncbi:MAG: DUF167 domain-containing protein [Opitutaceae bacterium]|nr:DUF167 domain-containing protein [Opitutaceae bacterium]